MPADFHSKPTFDFDFNLNIETTFDSKTGVITSAEYKGGTVSGLSFENTGFGLNIESTADLIQNYYFKVTDGYNPNLSVQGMKVTGIPSPAQINHAKISITEALVGTLAWRGNSDNDNVRNDIDALESIGLHYELAPDVQFVGSLTGAVPLEFGVDEDGDGNDGGTVGDPVVVKL